MARPAGRGPWTLPFPTTRRSLARPPHLLSRLIRWSSVPARRFVYKLIEDVEKLEYYRPGGYHPLLHGDCLHGRYRVVHKLGYGTFSTI